MTKIISGKYKGRSLIVPPSVTRPTSSRVREAVLSSVQHQLGDFAGLQILDLFAGSGALGFEALSRGAGKCVFVEKDSVAATCINQNARTLSETNYTVLTQDAFVLAESSASNQFDVLFLDPPYALADGEIETLLGNLAKNDWLNADCLVVVERAAKSRLVWPNEFEILTSKTYGDTSIWYGLYVADRVEA